ncbi:transposase [Nitrosococcus wardiae]|uniref:transposase n=1 Tax=Nitrosococcus wardiae TaxID=1814290 RepID=UPI003B839C6F
MCPQCGHDKAHLITTRPLYQCASCRYQVSVTAGTIFHSTKVPLRKGFWAILPVTQSLRRSCPSAIIVG